MSETVARMADMISPRGPQYALATDEQTNERMNRQTEGHCHHTKPSLSLRGVDLITVDILYLEAEMTTILTARCPAYVQIIIAMYNVGDVVVGLSFWVMSLVGWLVGWLVTRMYCGEAAGRMDLFWPIPHCVRRI